MRHSTCFTQLALAAGIVAALTVPTAIQASPMQENSNLGAAISLQSEGYTVPNAGILIASTAAKEMAPGFTTIGTERDIAGQGSLDVDAKYTFSSGGFGYVHKASTLISMVPGAGTDKTPIKTNIVAKDMTNGAANSGSSVIGHQVPVVGETSVANATADLVSYPARYAHGLELAGNTYLSIGNGATASGGTTNK